VRVPSVVTGPSSEFTKKPPHEPRLPTPLPDMSLTLHTIATAGHHAKSNRTENGRARKKVNPL